MSIWVYILQVILYTGIFWAIFRLALYRNTNLWLSRLYLWLSVALPFILPLVHWPVVKGGEKAAVIALPEIVADGVVHIDNRVQHNGYMWLILYLIITGALLVRLFLKHYQLRRMLKQHTFFLYKGMRVYTSTGIGPGSYGRSVFLPVDNDDDKILMHEAAHIRQHHHLDLLLLQLMRSFCWPNLFIYAIGKDLKMVHEYQADAIASGNNVNDYVLRLLDEVFGSRQYSISHSFFHHPIKNRINMLQQTKSPVRNAGKLILAISVTAVVAAGTVWLQSCNFKKESTEIVAMDKLDEKPEFQGDIYNWLVGEIKYPEAARVARKEGRTGISFTIDENGNVADVKVARSSGIKALDDEALRVVQIMPRWKPGNLGGKNVSVVYTLPISFKLS
jgi:TonB family protein